MPGVFAGLGGDVCVHSSAAIDFGALRGKRVAVVGAGASGFDNAGTALEAGAGEVSMLMRRSEVPRLHVGMAVTSPGINAGFYDLDPGRRVEMTTEIANAGLPAPRLSVLRCTRHDNFRWYASCPVLGARMGEGEVVLETGRGSMAFDFVIVATGFGVDATRRPELAHVAGAMRRWDEVYPEVRAAGGDYGASPYLGRHFEFLGRTAGDAWVERVYCMNFAGTLSHFKLTGDIPAISEGAIRLADGVVRSLFVEDYDEHFARIAAWDAPELRGDEWRADQIL